MRSIVNRMYHGVIQPIWNSIEAILLRVPLVYKITSWYSIFLLLMIGLLATFVMQFTHIWDQNEMRTDLQEKVIEAANHPRKYKPFDEGIFLLVSPKSTKMLTLSCIMMLLSIIKLVYKATFVALCP